MRLLLVAAVLVLALACPGHAAFVKNVLDATGDTSFGESFNPPFLNEKGACATNSSYKSSYQVVSFSAATDYVHLIEALFAPEMSQYGARVYHYPGSFSASDPCKNVNLTQSLSAEVSFRISLFLATGNHYFVISSVEVGKEKKPATGPWAIRISVADLMGIAFSTESHGLPFWMPPILDNEKYNCSRVGPETIYLGHTFNATQTATHDFSVWLTGQPSANVNSTVYVFDGALNPTSPLPCSAGIDLHSGHHDIGHFNEFSSVLIVNHTYTVVVVFEFKTKPTQEMLYGIQVAPTDRMTTNTTWTPYTVPEDEYFDPDNCTESTVSNKYNFLTFTAKYMLYIFDFIDAFDGNHTLLNVYKGRPVGLESKDPKISPATCTDWLGTMRDLTTLPTRFHSLHLRLTVGENYTVIYASQVPGAAGAFRPAIFSGPSVNPTPAPTTSHATTTHESTTHAATSTTHTSTTHTSTTHASTTHTSTTHSTSTGSTTSTGATTTGGHHSKSGLQGWQVALIVVGVIAGVGILMGGAAYYFLVVRKRPQYELIN